MGCQLHAELQDQKSYHWEQAVLISTHTHKGHSVATACSWT